MGVYQMIIYVLGYLSNNMYVFKNVKNLFNELDNVNFFDKYKHNKDALLYNIQLNLYDHNLSRINYIPGENNKLLLSWTASHTIKHGSILLDLLNLKGYHINTLDDGPVYKCAIDPLTEEIYFGKKIGTVFEERQITKLSFNNIKFTEIPKNQLIINKY